jgi:hypothetical protein
MTSQFHDRWNAILAWLRKYATRRWEIEAEQNEKNYVDHGAPFFFGELAGSPPG